MSSTRQDHPLLLTVGDRLDVDSQQQLRTLVAEGLARGYTEFLLDLQAVHAMDSAGLGALSACGRTVQQHGGHLTLMRVPQPLYALLELTRFSQCFETVVMSDRALGCPPAAEGR